MKSRSARFLGWIGKLRVELVARRAGRRAMTTNIFKPIRHIIGPTGYMAQHAVDPAMKGLAAFSKSFEPHIPPSIHVSHRDATRVNMAMPISERCIEDYRTDVVYTDPHDELDL